MKVMTILGARPQFIKSAPVSRALTVSGHDEVVVHTGQHYDPSLSSQFFSELELREPRYNIAAGANTEAAGVPRMLEGLAPIVKSENADLVLVYGDTNSTLAGALAAVAAGIPLAHVEAGLRSFNQSMPEEHNRVLTDQFAQLRFCPTATAVANLKNEGITTGVHLVGDVMYDSCLQFADFARTKSRVLDRLGLKRGEYGVATFHRPYNVDESSSLDEIIAGLVDANKKIVFPVHPRTARGLRTRDTTRSSNGLIFSEPLGYLDMLLLEREAEFIVTDSGGVQKEAFFFQVPCLTVRPETEWVETVNLGWNTLVGSSRKEIAEAIGKIKKPQVSVNTDIFGDGHAAEAIVKLLEMHNARSTG